MDILYGMLATVVTAIVILIIVLIIFIVYDSCDRKKMLKQCGVPNIQHAEGLRQSTMVNVQNEVKKHWLVLIDTAHAERQFECEINEDVFVGRSPKNQIVIDDDITVSGVHCRFWIEDGACWVEDMQSSNGTYINDKKITRFGPITNDMQIRIGCSTYSMSFF